MNYFTSDWHINDDRFGTNGTIDVMMRPVKSAQENIALILKGLLNTPFEEGDILWMIGDTATKYDNNVKDFFVTLRAEFPFLKINLVRGNYDDKFPKVEQYFDNVYDSKTIELGKFQVLLNHYPTKCNETMSKNKKIDFALFGHIHSLCKVKNKKLNVGVDVWNYKPISEEKVLFTFEAMLKHYDEDVYCE